MATAVIITDIPKIDAMAASRSFGFISATYTPEALIQIAINRILTNNNARPIMQSGSYESDLDRESDYEHFYNTIQDIQRLVMDIVHFEIDRNRAGKLLGLTYADEVLYIQCEVND